MKIDRSTFLGTYHVLLVLVFLLTAFSYTAYGQEKTKVRGIITDAQTGESLPFVNVVFSESTIGAISEFNGEYFIETRVVVDSIEFSSLGYITQKFPVKQGAFQTIDVQLEVDELKLDEVVVTPGENPAHPILRNIIANKARNNPDRLKGYQCEVYNKMELDATNINDEFKQRRVFNQFQFVFDYMDTSVVTGKSYLPIFISESLSDYYYQKEPKRVKEIIKANRISGVENESVSQYTGQMYIDVNVYDNFIGAFQKQFVSPIADFGLLTYRYYLLDSSYIDNQWCYLISFQPRRKQELTFTGEFWVHDSTFAIKKIKARIAKDANINFVDELIVNHEYKQIEDSVWFLVRDELFVDFNLSDSTMGFFGRKTTSYRNVELILPDAPDFFSTIVPDEVIVLEDAEEQDTSFWNAARHEKLSQKEESIYMMVDSIKNVPIFQTWIDVINMIINGYYVHGNFEYGPYFKVYSYNEIEGHRFRFGGRTSNDFSTKLMLEGHIAYGTKDQRFKYGVGLMYMLNKRPRSSVGLSHKHDIEQLGQSVNAFTESNILSSVLARNPRDKLLIVNEYKGFFEKEWFEGFSNTVYFSHRTIFPNDTLIQFKNQEDSRQWGSLVSAELTLRTRMAYNEKFIWGEFERVSLGSDYPILTVDLIMGFKNIFGSDYEYYKAHISLEHDFNINPLGEFRYRIQAGKIWGTLPFPLLRLHEGNETYAFDPYAFNMMNYYEFVSDNYISLYAEHHFEGLFLNKVPLFRKLKWREVLYGKALVGYLEQDSESLMDFPDTLSGLSRPYYEAGIGIENIFKIIRVDALWRFSYLDHPNVSPFGLRAGLQIIF